MNIVILFSLHLNVQHIGKVYIVEKILAIIIFYRYIFILKGLPTQNE